MDQRFRTLTLTSGSVSPSVFGMALILELEILINLIFTRNITNIL